MKIDLDPKKSIAVAEEEEKDVMLAYLNRYEMKSGPTCERET